MLLCTRISAQSFTGFVRENDSVAAPIYHAAVDVHESSGRIISSSKTYFDGSFKFDVAKDQNYTIHISVPGYVDTTYKVVTDNKNKPIRDSIIVKLRKDGMRLVGHVQGTDNLPIKNATLILKNVMTRKEDRQTTGNDGYFNFKLEYETNYRISVDKRSLGVINKYRDTTFYVSTVGFNMPLDYSLDVVLLPDDIKNTEVPDGYDAAEVKSSEALKPVIAIKPNAQRPSTTVASSTAAGIDNRTYTPAKAVNVEEEHKAAKDTMALVRFERDNNRPGTISTTVDKAAEVGAAHKAAVDSIMLIRYERDKNKPALAASVAVVKNETESKTKTDLAVVKSFESSLGQLQQEQKRLTKEMNANKLALDSMTHKLASARLKMTQDSIAEIQDRNRLIAQQVVAKKMYNDSVAHAKTGVAQPSITTNTAPKTLPRDSAGHAWWLRQQKLRLDSIQKAKQTVTAPKAVVPQSTVYNNTPTKKLPKDSAGHAWWLRQQKLRLDSIQKAKQAAPVPKPGRDTLTH